MEHLCLLNKEGVAAVAPYFFTAKQKENVLFYATAKYIYLTVFI